MYSLLAVRANEIYCQDEKGGHLYQFDFGKYPPNSHTYYERYPTLWSIQGCSTFEKHIINNLVDYATGVETIWTPTVAKSWRSFDGGLGGEFHQEIRL